METPKDRDRLPAPAPTPCDVILLRSEDLEHVFDEFLPEDSVSLQDRSHTGLPNESALDQFPSELEPGLSRFDVRPVQHRGPRRWSRLRYSAQTVLASTALLVLSIGLIHLGRIVIQAPSATPGAAEPTTASDARIPDAEALVGTAPDAPPLSALQSRATAPTVDTTMRAAVDAMRPGDEAFLTTVRSDRVGRPPVPLAFRGPSATRSETRTVRSDSARGPGAPAVDATRPSRAAQDVLPSSRIADVFAIANTSAPMVVPAPTTPATPMGSTSPNDTGAIQGVLGRYRRAFSGLDASAARAVWPTVDARALGRAFAQLEEQELEFDNCTITVSTGRAVASCGGRARYVPKVGSRNVRTDSREWTFSLLKVSEEWLIDAVDSR